MKILKIMVCLPVIVCSLYAAEGKMVASPTSKEGKPAPMAESNCKKPGHTKNQSSAFLEHCVNTLQKNGHLGKPNPNKKLIGVTYSQQGGNTYTYANTPKAKSTPTFEFVIGS